MDIFVNDLLGFFKRRGSELAESFFFEMPEKVFHGGIEPLNHDRVFGLFNKLDANSEGTGVGLTLAKRIIEVHDGKIWVESEGAGYGATFFITLPSG